MIRSIQLKQIYRNKRFLFFTIMVPSFYYIFMILMYKNNNQANFQQIINETLLPIYCECVLLGIVSNSLLTFGSKISSTRKFYSLYNRITTYTIHQFLVDQIMIQIIANLTISTLITLVGFGFQVLSFNWQTLLLFLLLNILGIYFTVIGFFMGQKIKTETFQMMSMPLILLVLVFTLPYHLMTSGSLITIITMLQQLFPIHYFYGIYYDLMMQNSYLGNLLGFTISLVLTLIPVLYLNYKKLK